MRTPPIAAFDCEAAEVFRNRAPGPSRNRLNLKNAANSETGMQTGTEISGAVGMTFNLRNTATNYQSGDELHIEAALNQHFPFGLAVGIGGFFYQQITGDYGSGDRVGPFRGRVAGVGPLLSYTLKADEQEVTFSGRWFHEFDVKRRFRGDPVFASVSFKL